MKRHSKQPTQANPYQPQSLSCADRDHILTLLRLDTLEIDHLCARYLRHRCLRQYAALLCCLCLCLFVTKTAVAASLTRNDRISTNYRADCLTEQQILQQVNGLLQGSSPIQAA